MPQENNNGSINCNEIPEWLNEKYMEKTLQNYYNDKTLNILAMSIKSATAKGDNYASMMYRVQIKYKCDNSNIKSSSYIVKTSYESNKVASDMLKKYNVIKCEMDFYENIIKKLNSLLKEIHDDDIMFAETISVDYKNLAMIFEDLSIKSFVTADRKNGLNEEHVKLALRKIAKMHSTAAVLNERSPGIFNTYDHGLFNRYTKEFQAIFCTNLKVCAETVKEFGNEFIGYSEKMMKLYPHLMERGNKVFDPEDHHFNTLIHGDFWINNIMFSYDGDEIEIPKDLVLIDFQFSAWTSPTVDLHYFFNTSLNNNLRLEKLEEFLQYYYNIMTDTLKALKFKGKIPSLNEFWLQYLEKKFYAFTSTCLVQPIMISEPNDDADFNGLVGNDEKAINFKKFIYSNKKVQQNLRNLLPIFDRQGLLDV